LSVLLLLIAAVGACGRLQARTPPHVAMAVPPPPVRVAIPVTLPEPEVAPEPPPPPPPAEPTRPRSEPNAPRAGDRPAPTPPAPAVAPEAPAAVLQTTSNVGALEQRTSGLLKEAEGNLDRVNYRELNQQSRAQYDRAISFIRDARGALNAKNFNRAEQLAVKAAALSRELVKG